MPYTNGQNNTTIKIVSFSIEEIKSYIIILVVDIIKSVG